MQYKHKRDCVHTKTFLHFAILAGYTQNAYTALWSVLHSDEMISELPSLKTKIEAKRLRFVFLQLKQPRHKTIYTIPEGTITLLIVSSGSKFQLDHARVDPAG